MHWDVLRGIVCTKCHLAVSDLRRGGAWGVRNANGLSRNETLTEKVIGDGGNVRYPVHGA